MTTRNALVAVGILALVAAASAWALTGPNTAATQEASVSPLPYELVSKEVAFEDGTSSTLLVPDAFGISVAAEGLGKARFSSFSPDGRLFVPDMVNFRDNTPGFIYILSDFNEETRRFESRTTYLSGLRNPNSLAFYTDATGRQWLYIALTDQLVRYPYAAGDTTPSGPAETIATFPDYRTVDNDVWHVTRTISFKDDTLYVSVGSSCNICEEPEDEVRAEIIAMNPEGENVRTVAEGLRNAVGLAWRGDTLYVTNNGPDHLGKGAPDDAMYRIEEGAHYGFPYCYESGGQSRAEQRTWSRTPVDCASVPRPFAVFGAHTAPLGLTYLKDANDYLQDTFLAALHGSFRVEYAQGYSIMRMLPDGDMQPFVDGFLKEGGERIGRPVHVVQRDANSFFFTDDLNGRLYYVYANE